MYVDGSGTFSALVLVFNCHQYNGKVESFAFTTLVNRCKLYLKLKKSSVVAHHTFMVANGNEQGHL